MSTIDLNLAFQIAIGIFGPLIGWLLKALFDRLSKLEGRGEEIAKEVHAMRVEMPTSYVRKEDHEKALDSIFQALRRIEEKLDHKADKP